MLCEPWIIQAFSLHQLCCTAALHPMGMFAKCSSVPAPVSGCHSAWRDGKRNKSETELLTKKQENSWLMRELLTDNSRLFSSLKFAINHNTGGALAAAASNFSRCICGSDLCTLTVRGVTRIKLESDTADDVVEGDQHDGNCVFYVC